MKPQFPGALNGDRKAPPGFLVGEGDQRSTSMCERVFGRHTYCRSSILCPRQTLPTSVSTFSLSCTDTSESLSTCILGGHANRSELQNKTKPLPSGLHKLREWWLLRRTHQAQTELLGTRAKGKQRSLPTVSSPETRTLTSWFNPLSSGYASVIRSAAEFKGQARHPPSWNSHPNPNPNPQHLRRKEGRPCKACTAKGLGS